MLFTLVFICDLFASSLVIFAGDIGYYEEDRHVVISDRLKELIKVKGLQVNSLELNLRGNETLFYLTNNSRYWHILIEVILSGPDISFT